MDDQFNKLAAAHTWTPNILPANKKAIFPQLLKKIKKLQICYTPHSLWPDPASPPLCSVKLWRCKCYFFRQWYILVMTVATVVSLIYHILQFYDVTMTIHKMKDPRFFFCNLVFF